MGGFLETSSIPWTRSRVVKAVSPRIAVLSVIRVPERLQVYRTEEPGSDEVRPTSRSIPAARAAGALPPGLPQAEPAAGHQAVPAARAAGAGCQPAAGAGCQPVASARPHPAPVAAGPSPAPIWARPHPTRPV